MVSAVMQKEANAAVQKHTKQLLRSGESSRREKATNNNKRERKKQRTWCTE